MKYTIFLYDYANDDNNVALIIDESQRRLVTEIFDFFDGQQDWGYSIFPDTNRVKDFSVPDTSEDKV
jgi:hypothetical protein